MLRRRLVSALLFFFFLWHEKNSLFSAAIALPLQILRINQHNFWLANWHGKHKSQKKQLCFTRAIGKLSSCIRFPRQPLPPSPSLSVLYQSFVRQTTSSLPYALPLSPYPPHPAFKDSILPTGSFSFVSVSLNARETDDSNRGCCQRQSDNCICNLASFGFAF